MIMVYMELAVAAEAGIHNGAPAKVAPEWMALYACGGRILSDKTITGLVLKEQKAG